MTIDGDLDIFGLCLFLFMVCAVLPAACIIAMAWLTRKRRERRTPRASRVGRIEDMWEEDWRRMMG